MSSGLPQKSLKGRVVRIASEPRRAAKGGYLFRGLELSRDDRDNTRIFIIFPEFAGDDLYEFPSLCWEGALVACFGLELNNKLEDGSIIHTVTPESELILEPFRPVSVTEAIEAASCIRIADVRNRVAPDEPFWMGKGKLVHTLFDQLLQSRGGPSEAVFQKAYQKALPAFMAMLPGSRVSCDDRSLESEARSHYENLEWWLRKNNDLLGSVQIEVDRVSPRLGLKGRADAVLDEGNRRTVLELKSGKVPVDSHLQQLSAYCLLFGMEGEDCMPDGYVLYSANGKAEKLAGADFERRRAVITGRNRVISLKRSYTRETQGLSAYRCERTGRCFSRAACRNLFGASVLGAAFFRNEQQRDYYDRWFRLLSVDVWAEQTEFADVLDPETLEERVREGQTVPVQVMTSPSDSDISSSESEHAAEAGNAAGDTNGSLSEDASNSHGRLHVEFSLKSEHAEMAPGEEVMLHRGDPCSDEAIRGRVRSSNMGRAVVSVKLPFTLPRENQTVSPDLIRQLQTGDWFLDRVPFSRGREATRHALLRFFAKAHPGVIREIVSGESACGAAESNSLSEMDFGEGFTNQARASANERETDSPSATVTKRLATSDPCVSGGLRSELNEHQESSIRAALDSEVFHIVHGPPGTGKTRVLARLIRICLGRGERVLVTCPTNVALDRLLVAVLELGVHQFLRIGGRSTVSRELLDALAGIGNPPTLLGDVCADAADFKGFLRHVEETQLVGATAYQCAMHPIFLRSKFDRVVVDEAGQLDEPATLAPLSLAPRFVLGGDHLQLPPVVKASISQTESPQEFGLERSLFERLFVSCPESRVSRLKVQYRMNLEVQEIPSRTFYDNTLVPSPDVARRRLNIIKPRTSDTKMQRIIDPDVPVVFVNVQGPDSGKARPEEAQVACRIVENLFRAGVPTHEVGIITPYRAQQALIRSHLSATRGNSHLLSVDTVDRFQGGEREVIILSLARSDGVTSFLADRKRLNVSLSRARSKLILLGHGGALREHPLFCSILEGLEEITV